MWHVSASHARSVSLGHAHYFAWHLPSILIVIVASVLFLVIARQLLCSVYGPQARTFRWNILGWCALAISVGTTVSYPYLRAAAYWSVETDGSWSLRNYLGITVATVPSDEVREVRARDLGGLGVGMGHIEVRREDGSVVRTVRLSRSRVIAITKMLGYARADLAQEYTDTVVRAHRYAPNHGSIPRSVR
jgi:hypothetical protein